MHVDEADPSGSTTARLRRVLPISTALAVGATMTAGSLAFACVANMGAMTMSPTSGAKGTMISTTAKGLKPGATYGLHFANTTFGDCMSFSGVTTLTRIVANSHGKWSTVTAQIPTNAKMGAHAVCGTEITPTKGQTGTTHQTFTVT